MKVEIKLNEKDQKFEETSEILDVPAPSCDVAIDIGQVLAANQALLKNMARKMDSLETKLGRMEKAYAEQSLLIQVERKTLLMLEAPPREFKAWEPPAENLDEKYFKRFSVIDRVFRPWVMRRKDLNN